MSTFVPKREFVSDVRFVLSHCRQPTESGKSTEGYSIGGCEQFFGRLNGWLEIEARQLDTVRYGDASKVWMAVRRSRVWVGLYLARSAYEGGAIDLPNETVRSYWNPALYVSDQYLCNLQAEANSPFSIAMKEHFILALEAAANT